MDAGDIYVDSVIVDKVSFWSPVFFTMFANIAALRENVMELSE